MADKLFARCPSCSTRLGMSLARAGKKARCPKCRTVFMVPELPKQDLLVEDSGEQQLLSDHATDQDIVHSETIHDGVLRDEPVQDDDYQDNPFEEQRRSTYRIADNGFDDSDLDEDLLLEDDSDFELDDVPLSDGPGPQQLAMEFAGNLKEELVPRRAVPKDVMRLVPENETFLFAGRPSRTTLYIRLAISGLGALLFNPWTWSRPLDLSGLAGVFVAVLGLGWIALCLYLTYMMWRTQFFAITIRHVVQRRGWFSHHIWLAPVHNVQCIKVNTGIIDRLLGLSSVTFETAAASGMGVARSGILQFSNIDSQGVLYAFSQATRQPASPRSPSQTDHDDG